MGGFIGQGRSIQHRQEALPNRFWVMTQTWNKLLFAHWPVESEQIIPLLPKQLELDTYEGQAWIGVIPFSMDHIRMRGLPPIPFASAFPEINVRTYVRAGNKPGVYFFSLDADHLPAVIAARTLFHLPYMKAKIRVNAVKEQVYYHSERKSGRGDKAFFIAEYSPDSPVFHAQPSTLEHWLTARYCLYTTDRHERLKRADIHHRPWLLQRAEAKIWTNTMISAAGLIQPSSKPILHYSEKMKVWIWGLKNVDP